MPRESWIRKIFLLLVIGLIGARLVLPARANSAGSYEPGQVVAKLAPGLDATIDVINQAYGTTTLDSLYNHPDIFLLQVPDNTSPEQLAQLMAADPRLAYAEPNYFMENPESGSTDRIYGWGGYDSGQYTGQDATVRMNLADAQSYSRGDGVVIAILDSGVQLDHPELADSLALTGFDFVDGDPVPAEEANGLDDDGDGQIDEGYGHGTHVAGIAHLVAPSAQLMPLRVLNSDGRGNDFRTADAILYAAYNGAEVINLSLGTLYPSSLLQDAVNESARMGAVVVAAAGNLNSQAALYPAAGPCAIAVASVDNHDKKSSFSSFGDWIGVVAPGENIYSTFPVSGYAWWSGTSMSTPFVAGQAALLRSLGPDLSLDQIGRLIGGTADQIDNKNPDYRGLLGKGEIDILASLQSQAAGDYPPADSNLYSSCQP